MKIRRKDSDKDLHERLSTSSAIKKIQSKAGLFEKGESRIFFLLVGTIFISEALIMVLLRSLPSVPPFAEAILDASLLSIIIFPGIYIFLFLPLKENIAERKRKDDSYNYLIENIGEGVAVCDVKEKFVFANVAAEKIFEAKPGSLLGVGLENFFSKENYEFIVNQTKIRQEGKASVYETEIILPNGQTKSILITANPQYENGIVVGTLAIFRDISDIKKAEDAIKYERNLLRTLINNLPDAVYVKDRESRKVIANPVDIKYMGFKSEEEVLGKNDYDIYPKEVADSSFADDQYVFQSGLPQLNKEDFFIDNQNQKHWMLNSKVPIRDDNGLIVGLVGIGKDITRRKEEEKQLKLLETAIESSIDAIQIVKIDPVDLAASKVIYVNEGCCKMTGFSKEDFIGKSPRILRDSKSGDSKFQIINNAIANHESCEMEIYDYKKNGDAFWTILSITPVATKDGKYTHWIAIKRDISERKQMEQELVSAKEKAIAGSKAKSEFLANMSHEIRTPLNSVIGFSDLLIKTKLEDTQHQYISAVYQSANSLLDIINQILDFSKIESGKLEIDTNKTDILELGEKVMDVISFQAAKMNIELLLNISTEIPRFIWTDALRLRQVLINLLGNAVKFTKEGEIEFKIELLQRGENGNCIIRFSVRDTGIGIDPSNQKKIFEAFSQEDASINRRYGGTGLGLAISKQLLGLMGSELKLESVPQKGSTFFFDISVNTMDGEAIVWDNIHDYKNILIVDDNTNNRRILKDMLSLKHINSDEAVNGAEAIKKIQANAKYDVVLMDYHMPELDGLSAIRKIRNDLQLSAAQQPIMLLHSSGDDISINAVCRELDIQQRLVKPIKLQSLYDALSKVGQQHKHQRKQSVQVVDKNGKINTSLSILRYWWLMIMFLIFY
jgi:PAS domain S-box-containing protein